MLFKEEFLHFIWKFRLYHREPMYANPGGKIRVIHPGVSNKNAGPDFLEAKIQLDDTLWAGQVEIHYRSSDWLLHKHQDDLAYENVILHVVYEHDKVIYRRNGSEIPVLSLKGKFKETLYNHYHALINATSRFPCERQLHTVDALSIRLVLDRQLIERFENKTQAIYQLLDKNKGDWEKTFYYFLCRSFGFKVNTLPIELLAERLDLQLLKKYQRNPMQLEALLFGQAGFLEGPFTEQYPAQLKIEYAFLQRKHNLCPMPVSLWKMLRMRPENFPTYRLAQLSGLLQRHPNLFNLFLSVDQFQDYHKLFTLLPINPYWETHYHFKKPSVKTNPQIGTSSVQNILINTICIFLYVYGKYTDQEKYTERAFGLLSFLPAERNSIVAPYQLAGVAMESAATSQALLQLNKYFCCQKKCLNCTIGIKILNR
ncbi:DUF2851 family protein [Pedobacter sp.]|uniref:DUF2851 family protein n=1 Tax=Pedobacter sp. TaxID=1411316 RepID=UPI003D7F9225